MKSVFRESIGHEETSSIPQWCLSGCCAIFNAGGFVGDEVRVVQSVRMETLHVAAQNPPLQIGKGRIDPKNKLRERFTMFADGQWLVLLRQGQEAARTTMFLKCVRHGRTGAAGGLSGMTTKHLKVVLNSARDSEMLWQMAEVRAEVLVEVVQGIRFGRMTALRKATGGSGQRHRCGGHFQEGRVKSSRATNR